MKRPLSSRRICRTAETDYCVPRNTANDKERACKDHRNFTQSDVRNAYELLAPGGTVGKVSPTTRVIKERKKTRSASQNLRYCEIWDKSQAICQFSPICEQMPSKSSRENIRTKCNEPQERII